MKVVVYTTLSCPYCDMVQEYLKENNIDFEEKKVDESKEVRVELEKLSQGFLGVPFIFVMKEDGTNEGIIGFDKNRLNEIFEIK